MYVWSLYTWNVSNVRFNARVDEDELHESATLQCDNMHPNFINRYNRIPPKWRSNIGFIKMLKCMMIHGGRLFLRETPFSIHFARHMDIMWTVMVLNWVYASERECLCICVSNRGLSFQLIFTHPRKMSHNTFSAAFIDFWPYKYIQRLNHICCSRFCIRLNVTIACKSTSF